MVGKCIPRERRAEYMVWDGKPKTIKAIDKWLKKWGKVWFIEDGDLFVNYWRVDKNKVIVIYEDKEFEIITPEAFNLGFVIDVY